MIKGRRRSWAKAGLWAFGLWSAAVLLFALRHRPHAASEPAGLGPLSRYTLPARERLSFEGRVLERVAVSSYVYLRVERAAADPCWVVTLASSSGSRPEVSRVRVLAVGHAPHFSSKRLARVFDDLYFAVVRPA